MSIRIGQGWDSHAFKPGVPLKIGGVAIEHPEGLAGHSDGDVLLHAITDALLGAVAAGDIGTFFPPNDPRWKDADSAIFLNLAIEEIQNAGYRIINVDTTLVLAAPKISPIAIDIRERIADMLDLELNAVSVKAKTPEGMNLDHVAQAHATVLIEKIEEPDRPRTMSAVIENQRHLEEVVEDLVSQVHGNPEGPGVSVRGPLRRRVTLPTFDTDDIT
jgi:2-C-methyl-D-erythritol 2,4-cyclodiphosphate synthase